MPPSKPVKVFFCYAPQDEELRRKLEDHLALLERGGHVESWSSRAIGAGAEWRAETDRLMDQAEVIVLLVSADFLASDHLYDVELRHALVRHDARRSKVIGILLRPCDWKHDELARVTMLPHHLSAKGVDEVVPVTSMPSLDEAFAGVVADLRAIILEERDAPALRISRNPPMAHSIPAPRG